MATGMMWRPDMTNMSTITNRECAYALHSDGFQSSGLEPFEGACAFRVGNSELSTFKPHNIW